MPWRPKKDHQSKQEGQSDQLQQDRQQGQKANGRTQSDQTDSDTQAKRLKEEIQQIIRDELKQVIKGEVEPPKRKTQVYGQKRIQVVKPMKIGDPSGDNCAEDQQQDEQKKQEPQDPQIKYDIELLTQAQMEMAEELAANLKELKQVISASQRLAKRIQAVLGQDSNQKG